MSRKGIDRREFLSTLATHAIALSSFPLAANAIEKAKPRQSRGNLFLKGGKPLLVEVRGSDAENMLFAGLKALGGLEKIAATIKSVLIKPNLVAAQPYPVISNPDFVFKLARHCLEVGFTEVIVADISTLSERGKRRREKFQLLSMLMKLLDHKQLKRKLILYFGN